MGILLTFDVEPDLHTMKYKSVVLGIPRILNLLRKYGKKGIFFTTCDCIERYPEIFLELKRQGHEIALHGYRHIRYDTLSVNEIEEEIKKAIYVFNKYLSIKPMGFRAPQHSINGNTLNLLEKYNFEYDSSYTPFNVLQFFFFPKKLRLNFTNFFSPLNPYQVRPKLKEMPTSSLLIPFVSLTIRVLPKLFLRAYINLIKIVYNKPVFYSHSWDFMNVSGSKIDKLFSHKSFIKKLDYVLRLEK